MSHPPSGSPAAPAEASAWFKGGLPRPDARVRLFCLPHAGAGASVYKDWGAAMAPGIEVVPLQLPGRENRSAEPAFSRLTALLEDLVPVLAPHLDRPFAIYGHSLGALVGFELARELRRRGLPLPLCLFAASRRAPQVRATTHPALHTLPDAELLELLRQAGGTPTFVLEHPRWGKALLDLVRKDLEVSETFTDTGEPPLPCPLFALGGAEDRLVPLEHLEPWREKTSGPFELRLFPGGHIFHQQAAQARPGGRTLLLEMLSEQLLRLLDLTPGARE